MVVLISNGDQECMDAMAFTSDIKLSPANGHIGELGSSSNPELHVDLSRSLDHELVGVWVVGCCCVDATYVTAVTHFGQSEGTNVFEFHHTVNVWHVLFCAKTHEGLAIEVEVHAVLDTDGWVPGVDSVGCHREGVRVFLVFSVTHIEVLLDEVEFFECEVACAIAVVLIDVRSAEFLGVIADDVEHFVPVFRLWSEECRVKSFFVRGSFDSVGVQLLRR